MPMAALRHTLRRLRAHAGQTAIVMLSLTAGVAAAVAAGVVCW